MNGNKEKKKTERNENVHGVCILPNLNAKITIFLVFFLILFLRCNWI